MRDKLMCSVSHRCLEPLSIGLGLGFGLGLGAGGGGGGTPADDTNTFELDFSNPYHFLFLGLI